MRSSARTLELGVAGASASSGTPVESDVSVSDETDAIAIAELDAVLVAESATAVRAPARRPRLSCASACEWAFAFASTGAGTNA